MTEVYKILVDDLKSVTINKKDQKIMIERMSKPNEAIPLDDNTHEHRLADKIFYDKDNKSKWERWGFVGIDRILKVLGLEGL